MIGDKMSGYNRNVMKCECLNWERCLTHDDLMEKPTHHPNCQYFQKKKVYKVSPSLADGTHWSVAESDKALSELIVENAILEFIDAGDLFNIKVVEMSDYEIDQLKELQEMQLWID